MAHILTSSMFIFLIATAYAYNPRSSSSSSELAAEGKDCSRCYECFACQNGQDRCTPIPGCTPYCSTDDQCGMYQSCIEGVCQKVVATEAPDDHGCAKNADCPDPLYCYDNECRYEEGPGNMCGGPQGDEPCFECFECNARENRCVPVEGCQSSVCSHDGECERNQVCIDGDCTLPDRGGSSSGDQSRDRSRSRSRDRSGCMTDDDCGGNKVCGSGECVSPSMSTDYPSGSCVWEGEVFGMDPCQGLSMEKCLTGGPMGSCIWISSDSTKESILYRIPSWDEFGNQWTVDLCLAGVVMLVIFAFLAWRCLRKRNRKDRIATARAQAQTEMPRTAGLYYQQL